MIKRIYLALLAFMNFGFIYAQEQTQKLSYQSGQSFSNFTIQQVYHAGDQQNIGSYWQHASGLKLFVLQFDTVPQTAIWVSTPPISNQGHSHALEHVLLGKSKKGRYLDMLEKYNLSTSGALTYPLYTQYKFKSKAGMAEHNTVLATTLDALFNASLDEEQIQQELYHFAVKQNQNNKSLSLIESGAVYQEMESYEQSYNDYYSMLKTILGEQHPYSKISGGDPSAIRTLKPQAIAQFYQDQYKIGPGISMLSFLPVNADVKQYLHTLDGILQRLPQAKQQKPLSEIYPVKAQTALKGKIQTVYNASHQEDNLVNVRFAWDVVNNISYEEDISLDLFFDNLNDYLKETWVKTKKLPVETLSCYTTRINVQQLYPACFASLSQKNNRQSNIQNIQDKLQEGIEHFMQLEQKPELRSKAYNKAKSFIAGKMLNYEVIFEYVPDDDSLESWKRVLAQLSQNKAFEQDLFFMDIFKKLNQTFSSEKSAWDESIVKAGFLQTPYIFVGVPSQKLSQKIKQAKKQRVQKQLAHLKQMYVQDNEQHALQAFAKQEESKQKQFHYERYPDFPKQFILSPDPELKYKHYKKQGVEYIETYFEHKNSLDLNILINMDDLPQAYQLYANALPYLLKRIGIHKDGQRYSYQDLADEWYKKGKSFAYGYENIKKQNYFNLGLTVQNIKYLDEALQAWQDNLLYADFSLENLKELRYLVSRGLESSEQLTQDPGDHWVPDLFKDIENGIEGQELKLNLNSYYSSRYDDYRLKWLLTDPVTNKEYQSIKNYFAQLTQQTSNKSKLIEQLNQEHVDKTIAAIAKDLKLILANVPQETMAEDYQASMNMILTALQTPIEESLQQFKNCISFLLNKHKLKIVMVGNQNNIHLMQVQLNKLLPKFLPKKAKSKLLKANKPALPYFLSRLQSRYPQMDKAYPKHLFFETANKSKANVKFKSKGPGLKDTKNRDMIDYMSSLMFSGSGPKSFFYQTWQAGLAYSNGISAEKENEKVSYAAYRVGDMEALLAFVEQAAQEEKNFDQKDLDLLYVDYFNDLSRRDQSLSSRGWNQALDIFYQQQPKVFIKHAKKMLKLRKKKSTLKKVQQAWDQTWASIWPTSNNKKMQQKRESVFLYVGDENDYQSIQTKLPNQTLYRVYARDFWFID